MVDARLGGAPAVDAALVADLLLAPGPVAKPLEVFCEILDGARLFAVDPVEQLLHQLEKQPSDELALVFAPPKLGRRKALAAPELEALGIGYSAANLRRLGSRAHPQAETRPCTVLYAVGSGSMPTMRWHHVL